MRDSWASHTGFLVGRGLYLYLPLAIIQVSTILSHRPMLLVHSIVGGGGHVIVTLLLLLLLLLLCSSRYVVMY